MKNQRGLTFELSTPGPGPTTADSFKTPSSRYATIKLPLTCFIYTPTRRLRRHSSLQSSSLPLDRYGSNTRLNWPRARALPLPLHTGFPPRGYGVGSYNTIHACRRHQRGAEEDGRFLRYRASHIRRLGEEKGSRSLESCLGIAKETRILGAAGDQSDGKLMVLSVGWEGRA